MKPAVYTILVLAPVKLAGIGGAERHINNLVTLLRQAGHCVTVESEDCAAPLTGLRAYLVKRAPALRSVYFRHRISALPADYDYILSFDLSGFNLVHPRHLRVLAGCATAFRLKALPPVSSLISKAKRALVTKGYHWLEMRASKGLGTVACSEGLARDVRALGMRVCATIEPPTDTDALLAGLVSRATACNELGVPYSDNYLVFIGRWEYPKGSDLLTSLADVLHERYRLILVGPSLEQVPVELHSRIAFCGSVPAHKMSLVYAIANTILLPTRFEGSSMVVSEALVSGTPVLTTAVGSGVDLNQAGLLSRVVLPVSASALEWNDAIQALQAPEFRASVLRDGHLFAMRYRMPAVQARWVSLLTDMQNI